MTRFSEKFNEIAGDSRFSKLELQEIFTSEEEQTIIDVKKVLSNARDYNEASSKIQSLGADAIKVLVKIGKKALIGQKEPEN